MKLIGGKLYLTEAETGIATDTLKKARQRGSEGYVFIRDIADGWMLQYDALKAEYKLAINQRYECADLNTWFKDNGFKALLKPDSDAWLYYTNYRYGNNKALDKKYIDAYYLAAQVLNVLSGDKKLVPAALAFIEANNVSLPATVKTLQRKLRDYKAKHGGYSVIVSRNFGNKKALKQKDEAMLRVLAMRPQNFDHALIANDYNQYAVANGLPTISHSTVYNFATKGDNAKRIEGPRRGMHSYRNKYDMVVSRSRPSHPLLMTVHDGFDWELYYQQTITKDGKQVVQYHKRKNVVVVVDAYNDYPLGFAIGETETGDLIKLALKNAAMHVAELTGGYHLQWEIKCDNFAKGSQEFFGKIAKHVTPSKVGNARDKVVESWFKRFNDRYTIRHHNYAGKNVDALKKNQPNSDYLNKHKSSFPDEAGVMMQIIADIEAQRADKREEWLTGWNNTPANLKRPISREDYLQLFATGYTERQLTNIGLEIQVQKQKYQYMLLEHDFMNSVGVKLQVLFDHADMSSVLAIDEQNRRRWLVQMKELIPMARMDQHEGTRTLLNRYLLFKEEQTENIIAANTRDWDSIMTRSDAEALQRSYFYDKTGNKHTLAEAKRVLDTPEKEPVYINVEEQMNGQYRRKGSLKKIE